MTKSHNLEPVALCHLHLVALPDIESTCTVSCVHLIAFLMLTLWLHHIAVDLVAALTFAVSHD